MGSVKLVLHSPVILSTPSLSQRDPESGKPQPLQFTAEFRRLGKSAGDAASS